MKLPVRSLLLALVALPALGCGQERAAPPPGPTLTVEGERVLLTTDAPQLKYLEFETLQEQEALRPLPVAARIAFDEKRTAEVGSPLPGRVDAVLVRVGDTVKRGMKLFSVRSSSWAELEHERALAAEGVAVKRRLAERTKELVTLQLAPEKESLAADAELREAQLALESVEARRRSLPTEAATAGVFWVTAPRDGVVVESGLTTGKEVAPERDAPLLRLADLGEVLVLAEVQEADADQLIRGAEARVLGLSVRLERNATVEHIAPLVDPVRRTVAVRLRAANADGALRPNAFVQVEFPPPTTHRIRVPEVAVVTDGKRSVLFVEKGGALTPVEVQPGRRRDGEVELLSGATAGGRYVRRGALLLLNQIDLAR